MLITEEAARQFSEDEETDALSDENLLTFVEYSQPKVDGKYENFYVIFSFENKFYRLNCWRVGSYYTDYMYGFYNKKTKAKVEEISPELTNEVSFVTYLECEEVVKKEIVKEIWVDAV